MSATEDQPRKQTAAERHHELAMAALQRQPAPPAYHVGLTLNAKGDVQIGCEGDGSDLDALSDAIEAKFDHLLQKYPRAAQAPEKDPGDKTAAAAAAIARARVK